MRENLNVKFLLTKRRREKAEVVKALERMEVKEFAKLENYCEELRISNPDSNLKL